MITIRPMTVADIPLGMRLKTVAGWNQTEQDWHRFLALGGDGCFVAQWGGTPVATTTTSVFGAVGWIAMVLVDPDYRRRGIATRLMQHAIEYLDSVGVRTIRLDATPAGRLVYEQLDFHAQFDLSRMEGAASPVPGVRPGVAAPECGVRSLESGVWREGKADSMQSVDDPSRARIQESEEPRRTDVPDSPTIRSLLDLDRQITATERAGLLQQLMNEAPDRVAVTGTTERCRGYVFHRPGSRAWQIGPCGAEEVQDGELLCDWAFHQCADHRVFVDIPLDNLPAVEWARRRGLREQRRLTRMYRGKEVREDVARLWASSGPEKG